MRISDWSSDVCSSDLLRPQILRNLRDSLIAFSQNYDHVVLDMAAGVDAAQATLADHDGRTIVVVTPDPTSITDAYRSEERRVGKECVSKCRSRGSTYN